MCGRFLFMPYTSFQIKEKVPTSLLIINLTPEVNSCRSYPIKIKSYEYMQIAGRDLLKKFMIENKEAEIPIKNFTADCSLSKWKQSSDISKTYNTVSVDGKLHIFLLESKFQVTTLINFTRQYILIDKIVQIQT